MFPLAYQLPNLGGFLPRISESTGKLDRLAIIVTVQLLREDATVLWVSRYNTELTK